MGMDEGSSENETKSLCLDGGFSKFVRVECWRSTTIVSSAGPAEDPNVDDLEEDGPEDEELESCEVDEDVCEDEDDVSLGDIEPSLLVSLDPLED
ncbi:unnamed protein product [Linum trigynum]|uniref:Uncharacterized protein n=1 Tax=Linum trigynum TaxID=586398 RepID=A0AAV2CGH9_9ROSI